MRAYYGQDSRWYQAAVKQKAGRIAVAGMTKDVNFELVVEGPTNDIIDNAYRKKYSSSPYLRSMISPCARSADSQGHATMTPTL
ncbi:DUF2255 family protein [Neobacillus cucumis]|uniref:DUF2255 family protein n=1 Tax=Neobacillus cucumis TaxID=1740721 RepID=UPI0021559F1E|nr:DUF2255 family protein [Neobacillus cucumis]